MELDSTNQDSVTVNLNKVILLGPDNYKDWLQSIINQLVLKDVYDVVSGLEEYPAALPTGPAPILKQKAWIKKDHQAWAIINSSLDRAVNATLPSVLGEISTASPSISSLVAQSRLLLEHLRETYSSARGTRRVELLRLIWRTNITEDEDPTIPITNMREAYNDLISSSNIATMPDLDIASAILLSLPETYSTLVQSFILRNERRSADVITGVLDEF